MRYHNSPTCSVASNGVCPGSTPKYPSAPGSCTSSTSSVTSARSGVTISSRSFVGNAMSGILHRLRFFHRFFDCPHQVERLLGQLVVLAFDDLVEALHRLGNLHILAFEPGELLRNEERLRQEALELAGARHGQ